MTKEIPTTIFCTKKEAINVIEHALMDDEIDLEEYEKLMRLVRCASENERVWLHYI